MKFLFALECKFFITSIEPESCARVFCAVVCTGLDCYTYVEIHISQVKQPLPEVSTKASVGLCFMALKVSFQEVR